MITVEVKENSIELRGHSKLNPGNDIVCSAVSALIYTAAGYIENHGNYFSESDIKLESGDARLQYTPHPDKNTLVDEVMQTVIDGILMIEDAYPENVKVLGRIKKM